MVGTGRWPGWGLVPAQTDFPLYSCLPSSCSSDRSPVSRNANQFVGPERRERVSHQTWCGEGCVNSRRRPVNSDVGCFVYLGDMKLRSRNKNLLFKKARKGFRGYPVATIAFYGPNDRQATKVAV